MKALTEQQLLYALVAIVTILVMGRGTAEIARRLRQPEVLGELIGGFVLGPSVLGALFPVAYKAIFLDPVISQGLSLLSWFGAILLLLIAGLEVDLDILTKELRPGGMAALFAIVPSVAAGILFASGVLHLTPPGSYFLGVVLSVTAVSVAAKILIERGSLRRRYAQVILAAGIVSEVLVWLMIAVVSSIRDGAALIAGVRTSVLAIAFFLVMMTVGRRAAFWAMRQIVDLTQIVRGQLTLVLVLTLLSASITQFLGLHALLGAFVFGVILSRAPRSDIPLKENLQTLVVSLFAPIFFVLAGMRVDLFKLGGWSVVGPILLLLVIATVVKVGLGALGGVLGGLSRWESLLVGVGLNLKGGTDVIVAILGAELGLISEGVYAMYAVVGILTVVFSPPLLAWLEKRVPPSADEMRRLEREEAARRAYMTTVEHVVVPMVPDLLPDAVAGVVRTLAEAKQDLGEIFDLTQLKVGEPEKDEEGSATVAEAERHLSVLQEMPDVELTQRATPGVDLQEALQAVTRERVLVAIGARRPEPSPVISLGAAQDDVLAHVQADVLVAIGNMSFNQGEVRRILVPINGLEYSYAAADVAGLLARATGAEITLISIVHSRLDSMFWRENDQTRLLEAGYAVLNEARFRLERLGIRIRRRVEVNADTGNAIRHELRRRHYQLVVMGGVNRGGDNGLVLGTTVPAVLANNHVPALILVTREVSAAAATLAAAAAA